MSTHTGIEWTDATWNPFRGCLPVSPGCANCYAMRTAARMSGPGGAYEGLVKSSARGPVWTGETRIAEHLLDQPLRWRDPRMVFVNSMSDLFYEGFSDEDILRVFTVMRKARQHTFQVLTKRAERQQDFMHRLAWRTPTSAEARAGVHGEVAYLGEPGSKPLPHVWMGVSIENQEWANLRIPYLLQTNAAVRFVSYEPALGPIDFRPGFEWPWWCERCKVVPERNAETHLHCHDEGAVVRRGLDWVIVGGESQHGARPFDLAWARSTVRDCRAAGVPVFVKQLGAKPGGAFESPRRPGEPTGCLEPLILRDNHGGDMAEWPEDLRVREFPGVPRKAAA